MNWLRELGVRERSAFVAAFGGWALDALDYMVFSFVIPTLISLWGITRGEAGLLATVTLLVSALGGWAYATGGWTMTAWIGFCFPAFAFLLFLTEGRGK